MVNVAQSTPQDWAYVSEGGSTIVFSYTGPFHPVFTGKVLRLRKISLKEASHDRAAIGEEDDPVIAFQNTVITALVPSEFLPDLDVVLLDADWLAALEALHDGDRPMERRAKDLIDKAQQKGILATDLVGGADIMAVEIKPKWGFMPNPTHLSQETVKIKTSTCRFCMHTRFKFKDGGVPTQYCPLDLYSGDETRVRKAIHDLWNGWVQSNGTLNNMKVFVSGKMIRPSESYSSVGEFLSAATEVHEAFATALLPFLRTTALKTISDLQRSLDALDIEGIAKLYAMACPNSKGLADIGQNPSLEQWQDFVASYHSVYCAWDHSKLCPENIDVYLMAYLLSATFKDCSVIFRIRRSDIHGKPSVDFPHAVVLIDLDLKRVDRMEGWMRLDRRVLEYCRNTTQRRSCVE